MRAAAALALALALSIAPAAHAVPPAGWEPDVRAARASAQQRDGLISFHVRTERGRWSLDADRTVPSASVIKAMLMIAYLDRRSVRARALTDADRALLDPMIRRSDNIAATRVRDIVGDAALRRSRAART